MNYKNIKCKMKSIFTLNTCFYYTIYRTNLYTIYLVKNYD